MKMRKRVVRSPLIGRLMLLAVCFAYSTSVYARSSQGVGQSPPTRVFRGHAIPCPHGIIPNGLTVLRESPSSNHFVFRVAVYGASHRVKQIRMVYALVCALPPVLKPQATACGFNLDLPYHVRFFAGRRQLFQITAGYDSCPTDLFVGSKLWRGTPFFYGPVADEFWHHIAWALGIRDRDLLPTCPIDPQFDVCDHALRGLVALRPAEGSG